MRRVLIAVHEGREEAVKVAAAFAADLRAEGIHVRVLEPEAEALLAAGVDDAEIVVAGPAAAADCELALVFGGDGTILRAAELCRGTETPVLGVNLGHVGFLAEADVDDMQDVVRSVVDCTYTVEERLTVDVSVMVGGEVVATNWALNEASVEKAARERMLEIVVEIDDRPVSRWGCDGIVCATPTGSTAYNFSAGGPIVWPEVQALLMVPISAHALFSRPLVVSPDSTLAIEVVGEQSSGVLWCDGRRAADLPVGSRVEVVKGRETVRLARLHEASFADRLVRKFDLPVAGWRGGAERRWEGRS
ncbi:NAD kinase [Aeromicrobium fastidiosum]|uniref:NAD kinase n=1 Tax=Aeromicrobium fastidiosum TaxID=52699 RepID=A0A641AGX8_9ACTN|nr:NAD kinase [Aeromicrobium fastidiosum]KAA1372523.1 NAD kinase [Aeromicrobium fastidiosum]MBP2391391.1 NAD+ kinase [Aeromicrobium fastidiosum]